MMNTLLWKLYIQEDVMCVCNFLFFMNITSKNVLIALKSLGCFNQASSLYFTNRHIILWIALCNLKCNFNFSQDVEIYNMVPIILFLSCFSPLNF